MTDHPPRQRPAPAPAPAPGPGPESTPQPESRPEPEFEPESKPRPDDLGLEVAARAFFPDLVGLDPVRGRDDLARIEAPNGAWRLRRWAAETPETRIAAAHAATAMARAGGIALAPEVASTPGEGAGGGSILFQNGRRYDAQHWLPGKPVDRAVSRFPNPNDRLDLPAVLPDEAFTATVAALARLHALPVPNRPSPVPELPLAGLVVAVRQAWSAQRGRLRPVATRTPFVQRWLALGERALPAAEAAIDAAPPEILHGRALTHLGTWPAHVLIDEETVGGLLGWEAAAFGSPLLDLAQAIVRLRGWTAAAVELAFSAYLPERRLDPEERRLLPAVAVLDLVASAGALLIPGYADPGRTGEPPAALKLGVRSLLNSLDVATAALAQATAERGKGKGKVRARRTGPTPPAGGRPARPPGGQPRERRSGSGTAPDRVPRRPDRPPRMGSTGRRGPTS